MRYGCVVSICSAVNFALVASIKTLVCRSLNLSFSWRCNVFAIVRALRLSYFHRFFSVISVIKTLAFLLKKSVLLCNAEWLSKECSTFSPEEFESNQGTMLFNDFMFNR